MDEVEVTARFDEHGKITPLSFVWKDIRYQVDSTGRRWQTDEGHHMLVMVPGGRVFELAFHTVKGVWSLRTVGPAHNHM
jgi:hypothetical protein